MSKNVVTALRQDFDSLIVRLERLLAIVEELDSLGRWSIILTDDFYEFQETEKWDGPSDNVIMEQEFNHMLERITDG
jgi:hypothetical protein